MKSINELKQQAIIILSILAFVMIYSLINSLWSIFILTTIAFIIIREVYEIRMKLTEDKMKHENYKNLKRIRELEEEKRSKHNW